MRFSSRRVPAGRGGEGGTPLPVPPGRFPAPPRFLLAALVAASVAVLLASPWLDERLVWCEWIAVAVGLLLVRELRGVRGEGWSLVCVAAALALAFHWAPASLAVAMQADATTGRLVAAPIVLWDALRGVVPFWFACRLGAAPAAAWLPAGLAAVACEACWPAVFPWKYGYAQAGWPWLVQSADLFGAEFTTFVLFAHAGALVWGAEAVGLAPSSGPRRGVAAAAVAICLLNAAYGFSALAWWEARVERAPRFNVTLVQADPAETDGMARLLAVTAERARATPPPDLVCWPECSAGEFDARLDSVADPDRVARLSRPDAGGGLVAGPPGVPLLCGGLVYEGFAERPRALYQSALLVDGAGGIRGRYHKRHLMPFGEYVPLGGVWPELRRWFPEVADFTAGTAATVLDTAAGPRLGVMLCYEDMVPAAARSLVLGGANVLVALVNGAVFTAPDTLRQHRQLARLRAVECRRSLVRCAATGETCVISPLGTIASALPLHDRAPLDATVPLLDGLTLASRSGPVFPAACGVAAAALAAARWRQGAGRGKRGAERGADRAGINAGA